MSDAHLKRKSKGSNASERLDSLQSTLDAALKEIDLQVLELEATKSSLRVSVEGVDSQSLNKVEEATKLISAVVDQMNLESIFRGAFELEVSSPGLERPLKTLDHFRIFKDALVDLKWRDGDKGLKRSRVRVKDVENEAVIFEDETSSQRFQVTLGDIIKAKTVFVWGSEDSKSKSAKAKSEDVIEEGEEDGKE